MEEGKKAFEVLLRGGGGTRVEAKLARGGVVLRFGLLEADTGKDPGEDRKAGVLDACFLEYLFLQPADGSMMVSQPDLVAHFWVAGRLAF